MTVVATPRKKRVFWLVGYAALSLGLGVWGAYDYWVRIPNHQHEFDEFSANKLVFDALAVKSGTTALSENEIRQYTEAESVLQRFKDSIPEPVPAYDRPLQLWVYMIGCGLISAPWMLFAAIRLRKQRIALDNDGTLTVNGLALQSAQIKSIDMSRWMSKSVATVHGVAGETLKIDDYMMQDAHLIVGRLANRFEPELWCADGTKVIPPEPPEVASLSMDESAQGRDSH